MKLTIEQLIAVCEDLKATLEALAVTMKHLPPVSTQEVLAWRCHYLRDVKLLLEESWDS